MLLKNILIGALSGQHQNYAPRHDAKTPITELPEENKADNPLDDVADEKVRTGAFQKGAGLPHSEKQQIISLEELRQKEAEWARIDAERERIEREKHMAENNREEVKEYALEEEKKQIAPQFLKPATESMPPAYASSNIPIAWQVPKSFQDAPATDYRRKLEDVVLKSFSEQIELVTKTVPKTAGFIQCVVRRYNQGISGSLYPKYELYVIGSEHKKLLLTAQKRARNWTGNYIITCDHENCDKKTSGFVGKLRSNFWGNKYNMYDTGENPGSATDGTRIRENMGYVEYESYWFRSKAPRKFIVLLPKVDTEGNRIQCFPSKRAHSLNEQYSSQNFDNILLFKNKQPIWNAEKGAYMMDFKGRVKLPSVKNFVLGGEDGDTRVIFGKVIENEFNLDVKYPFSLYQAFCLAISSIAHKYGCE